MKFPIETAAERLMTIIDDKSELTAFNAVKVYTDKDEFLNSPELAELFSGFQMGTKLSVMAETNMKCAYVLEDGSIYRLYEIPNGPLCLKEVTIHSSLSSGGVCEAICFGDSFIINRKTYYKKNKEAFDWLKTSGIIITD